MYNPHLRIHFVGIGGSGMSGLAEILLGLGFAVSGSDEKASEATERLSEKGATIFIGHADANISLDTSLVVRSTAVSLQNPEVQKAIALRVPVILRSELLAELMRLHYGVAVAGSHGKTTTTSIASMVMEAGGLDPTVIVGGKLKSISGGGKVGESRFLVAETDESDRSFLLLKPTVAVVTNIDREHMNAYTSFEDLVESFHEFITAIPFYGVAILCIDCPVVRSLAERLERERPIRIMTYGTSDDADLRAEAVVVKNGTTSFRVMKGDETLGDVEIPVPGLHIARNALAALAVGIEFGVPFSTAAEACAGFSGVGRRLEVVGDANGITVVNDYAHHPTEIRTTLEAAALGWKEKFQRLIVVFQPHRYSRMKDCMSRFAGVFEAADQVIVTEVYAAGEPVDPEVNAEKIATSSDHTNISTVMFHDLEEKLAELLQPGDMLICMGAGSIGTIPRQVLKQLRESVDTAHADKVSYL